MRQTLNQLDQLLAPISESRQKQLLGGTTAPSQSTPLTATQLQSLFDFSTLQGGVSSSLGNILMKEVTELNQTSVGANMLLSMYNYEQAQFKMNPSLPKDKFSIQVLSKAPSDPNAYAQYDSGENGIEIGNLQRLTVTNINDEVKAFGAISHELFHAFQGIVLGQYPYIDANKVVHNEATIEVDAYLFQGMAEKEMDTITGKNAYYSYVGSKITNSSATYAAAWNDIMNNDKFTSADYSTIVQGFLTSGFNSHNTYNTPNAPMQSDVPANITSLTIYQIFSRSYPMLQTVAPAPVIPDDTTVSAPPIPTGAVIITMPSGVDEAPLGDGGTGTTGTTGGSTTATGTGGTTQWYNPSTETYTYVTAGQAPPDGFTQFMYSDNPEIQNAYTSAYNDATNLGASPENAAAAASSTASYVENKVNDGETPDQIAQDAMNDTNQLLQDLGLIPGDPDSIDYEGDGSDSGDAGIGYNSGDDDGNNFYSY